MSQGSAEQHRGSWSPEERGSPRDDGRRRRVTWHRGANKVPTLADHSAGVRTAHTGSGTPSSAGAASSVAHLPAPLERPARLQLRLTTQWPGSPSRWPTSVRQAKCRGPSRMTRRKRAMGRGTDPNDHLCGSSTPSPNPEGEAATDTMSLAVQQALSPRPRLRPRVRVLGRSRPTSGTASLVSSGVWPASVPSSSRAHDLVGERSNQ
jgi:hypothetical protein